MRKGSILIFVIIVFLFFRDNVPYVSSIIPVSVSVIALVLSYIVFIWNLGFSVIRKYLLAFSIPIANMLFSIFDSSEGGITATLYSVLQLFIWAFVCEYILRQNDKRLLRCLSSVILISVLVTAITTYTGCLAFPGASRYMASGLRNDRDAMALYTSMNIGGFGFAYLLVLLLPFIFNSFRFKSKSILSKVLLLGVLVLFAATIYVTEYSTAILLSVFSLLILFLPKKLTSRNSIFVFFGIAVLGLVISIFLPSILMYFSESTESHTISIRMEELGYITSGGTGYGDAQGRIDLMSLSLHNFLNNIITGTGNSGGGHSYILDTLSKFGILGLLLVVLQFVTLYKLTVKPFVQTGFHTLVLLVYIMNFILCIMNTVCFYTIFLVFVPLYIQLYESSPKRLSHTAHT